jgi:hypothetical protein
MKEPLRLDAAAQQKRREALETILTEVKDEQSSFLGRACRVCSKSQEIAANY